LQKPSIILRTSLLNVTLSLSLAPTGAPEISNDDKLMFYALFKQATVGPNNTKSPSKFKIVERYKWTAWQKLGIISKDDAMRTYI
jgi:acyl-CoA-binding protein